MKKLIFIFLVPSIVFSQSEWVNTYQSQGNDHIISVDTDNSNNVYSIGYFDDTIDFDPSANLFEYGADGTWDFFVQKNDADGNLIWAKKIGGSSSDIVRSFHVDDQFIYVAGEFKDTVDFDPNAGVFELIAPYVAIPRSFLLKLDLDGNFVWVKDFESSDGNIRTRDLDTDDQGNLVFVGEYWGSVDFDPSASTNILTTSTYYPDAFICKFNQNGDLLWVNSFGDYDDDRVRSIEISSDGFIYLSGEFFGDVDFDFSPAINNIVTTSEDIFILKIDSLGNFIWVKSNQSTNLNSVHDMVLDDQQNIHLIGGFSYTVDFDPGPGITNLTSNGVNDIFIQKLDSAGQLIWVKSIGGTGADFGMAIEVSNTGDIYITGSFEDTVDFDPNVGMLELICEIDQDLFLSMYNSNGELIWISQVVSDDGIIGSDLALDQLGGISVCGVFRGNTDFDMSNGTNIISAINNNDAFVFRTNGGMLSSEQIKNQFDLLTYPNPVVSNLKFETDLIEEFELIIYDTDGSIISIYSALTNSDEVDLSNLSSGLYFAVINYSGGNLIQKFIKK